MRERERERERERDGERKGTTLKFVLQSRYYVHFRANTLGKGMNPLILPPAMGK